jgi:hypothetical protein
VAVGFLKAYLSAFAKHESVKDSQHVNRVQLQQDLKEATVVFNAPFYSDALGTHGVSDEQLQKIFEDGVKSVMQGMAHFGNVVHSFCFPILASTFPSAH